MFEAGEIKFVILRLLKEKPRHGYEVIKALEERMGGCYTPSPGTVYPTLQMLEDQGYVRGVEAEGKKIYEITPEGLKYLEEHRDLLDEIVDRVRETVQRFHRRRRSASCRASLPAWPAAPSGMRGGAARTIRRSGASRRS